jgi:hypothetical protein
MGQKANLPSVANEQVINEKGMFKGAWARYMFELWSRVGGGDLYSLGGQLYSNMTAVGNVAGGEDDLITYTLPKNTLHNKADVLEITAFGITAANGNNKTIKLILGTTTLFSTGVLAFNNKPWCIRAEITRTDAATQVSIATFNGDFALLTNTATYIAGTEDFTTNLIIKCTGTSGSSTTDDVIQKGLTVKLFPAF